MTRRSCAAALLAASLNTRLALAKSRITRAKVSAITDELAATEEDAIDLARRNLLQSVELRRVPGGNKEFAALTGPELRRYAAGLSAAKLKVSLLHAGAVNPAALEAAETLGAKGILLPKSAATSPAKIPLLKEESPELDAVRIRIDIWENRNWRSYFEKLERDNFQGEISLATEPAKADDALRELMHFIGEL